jgi:heat shock protein HspQ
MEQSTSGTIGQEKPRSGGGSPADARARFSPGQLIHHRLFDYRGVVVDVDATCQASDEWYEEVARTRPPRDRPWYHVLVHGASHMTYVAERNLEADDSGEPIIHPLLDHFFTVFREGRYLGEDPVN